MSDTYRIAIVGAGAMGHGLAVQCAITGQDVWLVDHRQANLDTARTRIRRAVGFLHDQELTDREAGGVLDRIEFTLDTAAGVDSADVVLESISEDLAAKQDLFEDLSFLVDQPDLVVTGRDRTEERARLVALVAVPVDGTGRDVHRVAGTDGVLLALDSHDVLAVENVLFVFDFVGVFRDLAAGCEREPADCEVTTARCLADQNSLLEALGRADGLVLDILAAPDERRRAGVAHILALAPRFLKTLPPVHPDMRRFRIGSAFGIPIQLDLTFLLVLPLFAFVIASQVELWAGTMNDIVAANLDPAVLSTGALPWVLGVVAAVGLFVGVVLHELGHSVVAMRFGFSIESITLWLFGGIANLEEMPEDWKQELYIAVAGPVVSVLVGVACYLIFLGVPSAHSLGLDAARFVFGYLALMNVALAAFNMLPGFPMDGGRVLRALLARTRPYAQATKIAAEVGKGFAILLGLFGLLVSFNLFLVALAFFIYIGASGEAQQTIMRAAFEGVVVGDIMTPAHRVETVDEGMSVRELIDKMFQDRHTGYPVEREGDVVGLVTLEDARAVQDFERDAYAVGDIMTTDIYSVGSGEGVTSALEQLQNNDIGRLLVIDDQDFAGLLTRSDIMTALSIIQSSGRFDRPREEPDDLELSRPQT